MDQVVRNCARRDQFRESGDYVDYSTFESDASFKILESPVAAESIEPWPQEDAGVESFAITLVEPRECLIDIAQRRIHDGNL